ncbi:RNA polymerase sigma-70 factor [Dysgonomonas sp. GY75]|uniref:RNA polymerase sigma factor n=1 Tax=Dysgonomonas sp. GY75 TaxID=2780419 RepID=UPI001883D5CB|nr:RNA polymerase sigma-70 factor [Dysgonomonas sp. GY75]MBF0647400.1 RNA polymerase sigma-70 factor [Dysgonomonas sp. GY75]
MILDLISKDDRNSFNEFYDLYYGQVFRYSYYFLKNTDYCKEVVSDVFLSIWKSRTKLEDINDLNTWIFVITRNECYRYLQKNENGHTTLDEIPLHLQNTRSQYADESIQDEEIDILLTKVINNLPERCKIIFLMARQEGLKPKEIAEKLSINESTVRVQMKIAIEKIVSSVKPHFPDLTFSLLFIILGIH